MISVTTELQAEPTHIPGARPEGISTPEAAAENIHAMFDAIAPTYDRANHLLSFGLDRHMWSRTARTLQPILARPEALVLDLCCGTGDLTLALDLYRPGLSFRSAAEESASQPATDNLQRTTPLQRTTSPAPILAADFSRNMLSLARPKFSGRNIVTLEADALNLPFPDASIDLVTFAFGFRNLSSYPAGLAELHRILRPGGQLAILECNQPTGLIGATYNLYFRRLLPILGGLISHNRTAYDYLPASVARFPRPPQMLSLIRDAHFTSAHWTSYILGTAGLYQATKP